MVDYDAALQTETVNRTISSHLFKCDYRLFLTLGSTGQLANSIANSRSKTQCLLMWRTSKGDTRHPAAQSSILWMKLFESVMKLILCLGYNYFHFSKLNFLNRALVLNSNLTSEQIVKVIKVLGVVYFGLSPSLHYFLEFF